MTPFTPNALVTMHSRLRDDVVRVVSVTDGRVQVAGTGAQFDAETGYQISHPNCWLGWRIEPA